MSVIDLRLAVDYLVDTSSYQVHSLIETRYKIPWHHYNLLNTYCWLYCIMYDLGFDDAHLSDVPCDPLSGWLAVCLSVCLFILNMSVCQFVHISVGQSVCLLSL